MTHRSFIPVYIVAILLSLTAIYLREKVDTKTETPVTWENPPAKSTTTPEVVQTTEPPKRNPGSDLSFTTASSTQIIDSKNCRLQISYPVLNSDKPTSGQTKINTSIKKYLTSNPTFDSDCTQNFKTNPGSVLTNDISAEVTINLAGLFGVRKISFLNNSTAAHPSIEQTAYLFNVTDGSELLLSQELDLKAVPSGKTLDQFLFEKVNLALTNSGQTVITLTDWNEMKSKQGFEFEVNPQGVTFFDLLDVQALSSLQVDLTWTEIAPYLKQNAKLKSFIKGS